MQVGIYIIYDKAAQDSGPIFTAVNDQIALRSTHGALKDVPPHLLPEYQLLKVADFDTVTMQVYALPAIEIDFMPIFKAAKAFYDDNLSNWQEEH